MEWKTLGANLPLDQSGEDSGSGDLSRSRGSSGRIALLQASSSVGSLDLDSPSAENLPINHPDHTFSFPNWSSNSDNQFSIYDCSSFLPGSLELAQEYILGPWQNRSDSMMSSERSYLKNISLSSSVHPLIKRVSSSNFNLLDKLEGPNSIVPQAQRAARSWSEDDMAFGGNLSAFMGGLIQGDDQKSRIFKRSPRPKHKERVPLAEVAQHHYDLTKRRARVASLPFQVDQTDMVHRNRLYKVGHRTNKFIKRGKPSAMSWDQITKELAKKNMLSPDFEPNMSASKSVPSFWSGSVSPRLPHLQASGSAPLSSREDLDKIGMGDGGLQHCSSMESSQEPSLSISEILAPSDIGSICRHNAEAACSCGEQELMQVWLLLAEAADSSDSSSRDNGHTDSQSAVFGKHLVARILEHYERMGDLQMVATILCVFSGSMGFDLLPASMFSHQNMSRRSLLDVPVDGLSKMVRYLKSYAEVLYQWGALEARTEVLKHTAASQDLQESYVTIEQLCNNCGAFVTSHVCQACQAFAFTCSVCQLSVRGLSNFCLECGHGGHAQHIQEWFSSQKQCPAGCGCPCLSLTSQFQQQETVKSLSNTVPVSPHFDPMLLHEKNVALFIDGDDEATSATVFKGP